MVIDCVVVEDEPLAMIRITEYIEKVSFLNLLKTFDNGIDAIQFLGTTRADLIFLDIQMDGFSGIQFLESSQRKQEVIITTAFDQYALKGFDLNVSDYLLKPYTFERFMQAVVKVRDKLGMQKIHETPDYVFIKTEYRLEKIFTDKILYIEGVRDYRQIHTMDKKIMTLETFGDLEKKLPERAFCRVHKSFLVSISKIELVERDRIKINKVLIPISETYRDNFYKLISPSRAQ
jgi:two-component system, LytTR family, response regulator